MTKPIDPIQLLRNSFSYLNKNFLVSDKFFNDDNLIKLFSGKVISWAINANDEKYGQLSDFDSYAEQKMKAGPDYPYVTREFEWSISKTGKRKGSIHIQFVADQKLSFSSIESEFKTEGTWGSDFSPIPLGEDSLVRGRRYFLDASDSKYKKTIELIFDKNAILFQAIIKEEEK